MIEDFLRGIFGGPEAEKPQPDPQLMFAALLVRAARVDHDYDPSEAVVIEEALKARYDLTPGQATALRQRAEEAEATTGDTVEITRAIKDSVPYEDRIAVIEDLWRVVLADGIRDPNENAYLRLVASLLGVNDLDSGKARQRVMDG